MRSDTKTIKQLETRFWQSMVDKDAELAMTMIADECLVTGPMGAMKLSPEMYRDMTREGKWRLDKFELSDVEVVQPSEDTAVIAYKIHQTGDMDGKPMDLTCADASTWVREGGDWKCTLHTETVREDASQSTKH